MRLRLPRLKGHVPRPKLPRLERELEKVAKLPSVGRRAKPRGTGKVRTQVQTWPRVPGSA